MAEQGEAKIHDSDEQHGCLTVKLRGRPEAPDKRRGRTLSSGARGAKQTTHHGPLQRLLDPCTRLYSHYKSRHAAVQGVDVAQESNVTTCNRGRRRDFQPHPRRVRWTSIVHRDYSLATDVRFEALIRSTKVVNQLSHWREPQILHVGCVAGTDVAFLAPLELI